jgi:hypothetical protein
MPESQSTTQDSIPKTQKVSIQEHSVQVNDLLVVSGYCLNCRLLRDPGQR